MQRTAAIAIMCVLAVGSWASAALVVSAGDWDLQPNQGGQVINVTITGTGNVTNATVNLAVGGSDPRPSLTGGDIVSATIFALNNTGAPSYDFSDPTVAYLDVATNAGTIAVNGTGVLAQVTVDTNGLTAGTFPLTLEGTPWGDTFVGTDPSEIVTFQPGSIIIVPEPAAFGLLCAGLLTVTRRRR